MRIDESLMDPLCCDYVDSHWEWYDSCKHLNPIQCTSHLEVESSVLVHESMYV